MKNREEKIRLIENGSVSAYRRTRRQIFEEEKTEVLDLAMESDELCKLVFGINRDEVLECERIRKSSQQQKKKIFDHLMFLKDGNWGLFFVTFTFTDKALETTSAKTRKQHIIRCLSKFCDDYIVNIDYGKTNGREHYHSIIAVTKDTKKRYLDDTGHIKFFYLDENYRYGDYDVEECRTDLNDVNRLSFYITKLTLHSVKVRQSYVSVKKGSPYQKYKDLIAEQKRAVRSQGRIFVKDGERLDEEIGWLLSGYCS